MMESQDIVIIDVENKRIFGEAVKIWQAEDEKKPLFNNCDHERIIEVIEKCDDLELKRAVAYVGGLYENVAKLNIEISFKDFENAITEWFTIDIIKLFCKEESDKSNETLRGRFGEFAEQANLNLEFFINNEDHCDQILRQCDSKSYTENFFWLLLQCGNIAEIDKRWIRLTMAEKRRVIDKLAKTKLGFEINMLRTVPQNFSKTILYFYEKMDESEKKCFLKRNYKIFMVSLVQWPTMQLFPSILSGQYLLTKNKMFNFCFGLLVRYYVLPVYTIALLPPELLMMADLPDGFMHASQ